MRFLIIITLLLFNVLSYGQETTQTPAASAPTATGEISTDESAPAPEPIKTGFVFNPNFTMGSRNLSENSASLGRERFLLLDSKVGYVFDFGLFTGASVVVATGSAKNGPTDVDSNTYYAGPTIGYSCNLTGLFLAATYHVVGQADFETSSYKDVKGFQLDIGYPMKISDTLKFGPQLSWKNLEYKEGTTGLNDTKSKEVTPYFGLWLYF